MGRHLLGLAGGLIKTSATGAQPEGTAEGSDGTGQVDNARASKVNNTYIVQRIRGALVQVPSAHPPRLSPDPVSHDRVDKSRQNGRVQEVSPHAAALSDGTRHDRSSSSGKSEIEEEVGVASEVVLPDVEVVGGVEHVFIGGTAVKNRSFPAKLALSADVSFCMP